MRLKGTINRTLSTNECDWLSRQVDRGTVVYAYHGYTYGCVSDEGIAVTEVEGTPPFFEVPRDSVNWESTNA